MDVISIVALTSDITVAVVGVQSSPEQSLVNLKNNNTERINQNMGLCC